MNKLLKLYDAYALKALVCFLILFTALYPKLPSVHIIRTWVYIRLEDFFILATAFVWLVQVLRRKVTFPLPFVATIGSFWLVGLVSVILSLLFIGPYLTSFFPHLAILSYLRRIEYMILFFIAFSTIKSVKDIRDYFVILSVTVFGVFVYGMGQRYYLELWAAFPAFFQKYSFCFPSFQTGNEEFAKGLPLCLPKEARINSTFGGHYDLAAYLVLVLPIFIGVFFSIKKWYWKTITFFLYIFSLILLLVTSSRTSFLAYILAASTTLIFYKKKWFIIPLLLISTLLLFSFSETTAKRLFSTFRISSIVVDSQGQVVGEELPDDLKNKISKPITPPPAQDLQLGSAVITLPQTGVATDTALVKKSLSAEEAQRLKLAAGSIELSTISGTFLVKKALVYDISFTTRFQAEWPNAWTAFLRNPFFGSGYSTITLATDNDYFRALGETGMLGLLSFILIFIIFAITVKETARYIESKFVKGFIFGLSGGIIGLGINAVLIDVFEASKVAENLWILLGIGVGGLYLFKEKTVPYFSNLRTIFTSQLALGIYLIILTLWAFLSGVTNFFVADDFTWLYWAASSDVKAVIEYFTNATNFFYRPLDKLTIFALYNFFGIKPEGYHSFIMILNFFATLAVYFLATKIFKKRLLGFLAAVLFLVNPSHSENIFWLSTISVTLCSVLILYAVLSYLAFRQKRSVIAYIITFVLSIFAFLSYEMAVIIPVIFVVLDLFIVRVKWTAKTIFAYIPFVLLIPLYFFIRQIVHAFSGGGDYSYNFMNFVPNVIGNYMGYIGLFISGERFFTPYAFLRESMRENMLVFASIVVVLLALGIGLGFSLRKKLIAHLKDSTVLSVGFGLVFAFVSLMPFLGLGNIAPRYNFLASVGFSIAFIALLSTGVTLLGKNSKKKGNLVLIGIVAILVLFAHSENNRVRNDWKKAGEITKSTLLVFRKDYYDKLSKTSQLYFVNTPIKYRNAWVFPLGLRDGLWIIYREKTPQVYEVPTVEKAQTLNNQSATTSGSYIFIFDKQGNMSSVK